MSIFGWSYPPGAANDPNAPYNQTDGPCLICGLFEDDCKCPECPECGSYGDPDCYEKHGLVRTPQQIESLAKQEAAWAEDAKREAAWIAEQEECMDDGDPMPSPNACRHGNEPGLCDTCDFEGDIAFDANRERR